MGRGRRISARPLREGSTDRAAGPRLSRRIWRRARRPVHEDRGVAGAGALRRRRHLREPHESYDRLAPDRARRAGRGESASTPAGAFRQKDLGACDHRAGRRIGCREFAHQSAPRRRPLHRERREDLHHVGRAGGLHNGRRAHRRCRTPLERSHLSSLEMSLSRPLGAWEFGVMTVLSMSRAEIDRVHVLKDLLAERIRPSEAAQLMGVTRRQVFRLLKAYHAGGPAALISKKRGKPSNRAYPAVVRTEAMALIKANYGDFGPTLAAEKLSERHGLHFGVETVRRWMLADGLWQDRRQRLKRVYQPRHRRDCVGELIQIDGSEHWWFEDRGPQCTLLVFIDDATSRLMHLRFAATDSTFDYFAATRAYLQRYGKPIAFYSDKHATFRV